MIGGRSAATVITEHQAAQMNLGRVAINKPLTRLLHRSTLKSSEPKSRAFGEYWSLGGPEVAMEKQ
jgi:hypothetical protein